MLLTASMVAPTSNYKTLLHLNRHETGIMFTSKAVMRSAGTSYRRYGPAQLCWSHSSAVLLLRRQANAHPVSCSSKGSSSSRDSSSSRIRVSSSEEACAISSSLSSITTSSSSSCCCCRTLLGSTAVVCATASLPSNSISSGKDTSAHPKQFQAGCLLSALQVVVFVKSCCFEVQLMQGCSVGWLRQQIARGLGNILGALDMLRLSYAGRVLTAADDEQQFVMLPGVKVAYVVNRLDGG